MGRIQESLALAGVLAATGGALAEAPAADAQPVVDHNTTTAVAHTASAGVEAFDMNDIVCGGVPSKKVLIEYTEGKVDPCGHRDIAEIWASFGITTKVAKTMHFSTDIKASAGYISQGREHSPQPEEDILDTLGDGISYFKRPLAAWGKDVVYPGWVTPNRHKGVLFNCGNGQEKRVELVLTHPKPKHVAHKVVTKVVTGPAPEQPPTTVTVTTPTPFTPQAGVSVTKQFLESTKPDGSVDSVAPADIAQNGDTVEWQSTTTNTGNDPLSLAYTDVPPQGESFDLASFPANTSIDPSSGDAQWVGTALLQPGASVTLTYDTYANAEPCFTNTVNTIYVAGEDAYGNTVNANAAASVKDLDTGNDCGGIAPPTGGIGQPLSAKAN